MALVGVSRKVPARGSEGYEHLSRLSAAAEERPEFGFGHAIESGERRISDPRLVDAMIGRGRARRVEPRAPLYRQEGDWG